MLQVDVLNVSSTSDVRCVQVLCVSNVCLESHGGTTHASGEGARRTGASRWGAHLVSCRRSVLVLIPALESRLHGERGGVQGEGATGAGWGETDGDGVRVRGGTRQMGKDYIDTVRLRHVFARPFDTVRWNPIPSDIRADSHASLHDKEGSVCLTSPHSITVLDPLKKKKRSTTALPSGVLDKIISLYSRAESIPSVTTSLLAWTLLIGIDLTNNKCSNQPLSEHPACHVPKEFSLDAPYTATAIPRFLACCFPIVVQSI
jgi:hypothetical protein